MNLVVVELPAKAKTINKYLGRGYEVLASFGHVRDLPAKNGSVDPDADFRMIWEVDAKAQKRLNDIARAAKGADKLILATDPDREGEAISWHVLEVLKQKKALNGQTIERVVFNAITKQAVTEAMAHPRHIDQALVDAYLARRALDYLVGFTLSPVLWRKLPGARSAGRVQSVALRLVCDRELEIEKFVRREYWSLLATLATPRNETFEARLVGADGKKLQRLDIGSGAEAEAFKQALETATFTVAGGRSEAGQAASAAAVHHLDVAAGSEPQARFRSRAHHAGGAAPLRRHRNRRRNRRPHHLYAHRRRADRRRSDQRRPPRDRNGLRRQVRAACAAALRNQGQERAGSARGDPPDRSRPPAARRQTLSRCGPGQALRADLAAHGGEPDGIGRARAHHGRHHREGRRPTARTARHRHGREVRRLPRALPGRPRRRRRRRGGAPAAADERGRKPRQARDRRHPAFHRAAAALLRGLAGQAAGRARHRPAVDLRVDPAGAQGPQIRAARQAAALSGGPRPHRRRLPRELFRQIRRVRFHRRASKSSSI